MLKKVRNLGQSSGPFLCSFVHLTNNYVFYYYNFMNPEAIELLEKIVKKGPNELNPDERAFLRARSTYLSPEQKKIFKSILTPAQAASNQAKADGEGKKNTEPSTPPADETPKDPVTPPADNPGEPSPATDQVPVGEPSQDQNANAAQPQGDVTNGQSEEVNPYGGGGKDPDAA